MACNRLDSVAQVGQQPEQELAAIPHQYTSHMTEVLMQQAALYLTAASWNDWNDTSAHTAAAADEAVWPAADCSAQRPQLDMQLC
jgi:hypothetical protein